MTEKKSSTSPFGGTVYPLSVSVSMIVIAVVLSLVDLTFLNDVIGKVLDFGATESMAVAFALGLVGIVIMAHQGIKAAHGAEKFGNAVGHYLLWIFLGLAFVLIRLFSASILQLDSAVTDETILDVLGLNIRQIDLVLAPLMFFLYIATGLMVKDGFKNLLLNPEFETRMAAWKKSRDEKKLSEAERRAKAEEENAKKLADAEKTMQELRDKAEKDRATNALNGTYSNALAQFRAKEREIKEKHQKISANIDFIKSIDKQEKEFETKVKPGLLKIVQESIYSVQNSVALAIRKKTGEDIANLRSAIESYNTNRHE